MAKELDAMVAGPTADEVRQIRSRFAQFVEENGRSNFDERDIQRLMFDDDAVARYFKHVWEVSGDQVDNALDLIKGSLAWRRKVAILDLRASDLSSDVLESGVLYLHNRDRDNRRLLVLDVKKYDKTKLKASDVKQLLHYLAHRVEREENYDKVSLVFDCIGSGLRNLDLDTTTYIVNYFKLYSPWSLHNILVLEMPWVLNATWNIMKALMPASAVRKTKFIKRQQLPEYIHPDQIMVQWGGNDPWTYSFEPESPDSSKDSLPTQVEGDSESRSSHRSSPVDHTNAEVVVNGDGHVANGNIVGNGEAVNLKHLNDAKKEDVQGDVVKRGDVVIKDGLLSPEPNSGNQVRRRRSSSRPNLLELSPSHEIVFATGDHRGDLVAKIEVKNISNSLVAFKVKTTSPDKFTVRPSMASLAANQSVEVEIHVPLAVAEGRQSSIESDKFLFSCIRLDSATNGMTKQAILELLKTRKADKQYRLKCLTQTRVATGNLNAASPTETRSQADDNAKVLDIILRKLSASVDRSEALESEVRFLKRAVFLGVMLTLLVLCYLVFANRFSGESTQLETVTCPQDFYKNEALLNDVSNISKVEL